MAKGLPRLVGVVGAGQMGTGIAQVLASSGLEVRGAVASPARPTPAAPVPPVHSPIQNCVATPAPTLLQVVLVDRAAEQLDKAVAGMRTSLAKLAGKGALGGQEPGAVMARLQRATDLEVGRCCPPPPPPPSPCSGGAVMLGPAAL